MVFLGQAFTIMLVYVWSRRNPYVRMNFFGVLSFNAPYLPWVLLLFSLLLGNNAIVDFMGELNSNNFIYLIFSFKNFSGKFLVNFNAFFLIFNKFVNFGFELVL